MLAAGAAHATTLRESTCTGIDVFEVCQGRVGIAFDGDADSLSATVDMKRAGDASEIRPQFAYTVSLSDRATLATGITAAASTTAPGSASTALNATLDIRQPLPIIESFRWQLRENEAGETSHAHIALASPLDSIEQLQADLRSAPDGTATYEARLGMSETALSAGEAVPAIRSLATVRRVVREGADAPVRVGVMTELRQPQMPAAAFPWSPLNNYLVRLRYEEGEAARPSLEYRRIWSLEDAGEMTFDLFLRDEATTEGCAAKLTWNMRF
ncbi:hypothetical protein [Lentisalinibacter sediminis]|uniref:hypothetical protein n=1 Tax=Lentisalinibacter sediminis TaxID=2992237 RepID=UPI003867A97B